MIAATMFEICGERYAAYPEKGTPLAPVMWLVCPADCNEVTYYTCRLPDGTIQCDCGDSVFGDSGACKHWRALAKLGLI